MKRMVAAVLALCLLFVQAAAETPVSKYTDIAFSTANVLSLYVERETFDEVWAEVKAVLAAIDSAVSVSDPASDVARFNALSSGESCMVSAMTAEMLLLAREVWQESDGLYDPSVYPLVDLWGFSPRFNSNAYRPTMSYDRAFVNGALPPPVDEAIAALLPLVDFSGIGLEETAQGWRMTKSTPEVTYQGQTFQAQIDLGGIAKGYACDRVREILESRGVTRGYFTSGGSSMTILFNASNDGFYETTIRKPRPGATGSAACAAIPLRNTGLSTSSDSNHCRRWEDTLYCHIIDPRTGIPVNVVGGRNRRGIVSATLTGSSAARCDALTTAIMLMGEDAAPAFLKAHPEYECLYVVSDPDESVHQLCTTFPTEMVKQLDEAYRLIELK